MMTRGDYRVFTEELQFILDMCLAAVNPGDREEYRDRERYRMIYPDLITCSPFTQDNVYVINRDVSDCRTLLTMLIVGQLPVRPDHIGFSSGTLYYADMLPRDLASMEQLRECCVRADALLGILMAAGICLPVTPNMSFPVTAMYGLPVCVVAPEYQAYIQPNRPDPTPEEYREIREVLSKLLARETQLELEHELDRILEKCLVGIDLDEKAYPGEAMYTAKGLTPETAGDTYVFNAGAKQVREALIGICGMLPRYPAPGSASGAILVPARIPWTDAPFSPGRKRTSAADAFMILLVLNGIGSLASIRVKDTRIPVCVIAEDLKDLLTPNRGREGASPVYRGDGQETVREYAIPDSFTIIGAHAMEGYRRLGSVTLPGSVRLIEDHAFAQCTALKRLAIPDGTAGIGSKAFAGCYGLTSVSIPGSVVKMGADLFADTCLTSLTLEEGITETGAAAFRDLSMLESVRLPESLKTISAQSFRCCFKLASAPIPRGVTAIEDDAFDGCRELADITIPEGVQTIGSRAFGACESLGSIVIPGSAAAIGELAFYGCKGLRSLTLEEGVKAIGEGAFRGCGCLTELRLPAGLEEIGEGAFRDCPAIKDIWFGGTRELWQRIRIGGDNAPLADAVLHTIEDYTYTGPRDVTEVTIPEGAAAILDHAFAGCGSLNAVHIPKTVTDIGASAFENCAALADITLPEGLTSIGASAFKGCKSLTSITVPGGVEELKPDTFRYCSGLTSVTLEEGVTGIGHAAFLECTGLKKAVLPDTLRTIGESAFAGCRGLNTVQIPDGVTDIGADAFRRCVLLQSVKLPGGITSVPDRLFQDCKGLSAAEIPEGVTVIGASAFAGCQNLKTAAIPEGLLRIEDSAFSGCGALKTIRLPESVTDIGKNAFAGCTVLSDVFYGGTKSRWHDLDLQSGKNHDLFLWAIPHFEKEDPPAPEDERAETGASMPAQTASGGAGRRVISPAPSSEAQRREAPAGPRERRYSPPGPQETGETDPGGDGPADPDPSAPEGYYAALERAGISKDRASGMEYAGLTRAEILEYAEKRRKQKEEAEKPEAQPPAGKRKPEKKDPSLFGRLFRRNRD